MQRYIVFLNDRSVIIDQDINITKSGSGSKVIEFTSRSALANAYESFYGDADCESLIVKSAENYVEACNAFNSLFIRIEAAGGIVRNNKEEYLFIRRLGVWDLPKGKLHKKEIATEGALREVEEETGLKNLVINKELPSTFHIYKDRDGKAILKETYWFEMMCHDSQILVPQLEEDITEVKWFSASEINIPVQNTYASLRHLLQTYMNLLKK